MPEWLTIKEYAAWQHVHRNTVGRWLKRGYLRTAVVGIHRRILARPPKRPAQIEPVSKESVKPACLS